MNIPTEDRLRQRPRLGTPQRGVRHEKLVENQTDADLIQGVTVDSTAPSDKQVIAYNAVQQRWEPTGLSTVSSNITTETIFASIATMLQYGPSNISFRASGPNLGDIVMGAGGFMRMEVLTIARVGATAPYSPVVTLNGAHSDTTTVIVYTSAGDPVLVGQHIFIDAEAMLVQGVDTGTNQLTVARGRLSTFPASHSGGVAITRVSVESVVHVPGGIRATGGIATSDLALQGDSTQELLVRRTFTKAIPTYVGLPDGGMHLHVGEHSHAADTNYRVEIDTAGPIGTATFRWSDDGGGTWDASLVATSQNITHLQNGVYVSWDYGVYTVGSRWDFTAVGTANQVELVRADTTADLLHLRNIDLSLTANSASPVANINGVFVREGSAGSSTQGIGYAVRSNTTVLNQSVYGINISAFAGDGAAATFSAVAGAIFQAGRIGTNVITDLFGVQIQVPSVTSAGVITTTTGLQIRNQVLSLALTQVDTIALNILAQTGTPTGSIYNIRQQGTTGVNRFAAPTLIGADASPAAGVALELRGGRLRMAATANDYIEDSAGLRHLTFATDATVAAVVSTFAGDLRVNGNDILNSAGTTQITFSTTNNTVRVLDRLGINSTPAATLRLDVNNFPTDSATATHTVLNVGLAGQLTADRLTGVRRGFAFQGTFLAGTFTLLRFTGIDASAVVYQMISDGVTPPTLTSIQSLRAGITIQEISANVDSSVLEVSGLDVAATSFISVGGAFAVLDNVAGVRIRNQGHALVTGTSYGLRMLAQSASPTTLSLVVEGSAPSIHQPFLTIGANAAPAVSGALDISTVTGALLVPRMTTAQKNALTAIVGMIVYDTTLQLFHGYQGAVPAWLAL